MRTAILPRQRTRAVTPLAARYATTPGTDDDHGRDRGGGGSKLADRRRGAGPVEGLGELGGQAVSNLNWPHLGTADSDDRRNTGGFEEMR